jgi:hypothetical protein
VAVAVAVLAQQEEMLPVLLLVAVALVALTLGPEPPDILEVAAAAVLTAAVLQVAVWVAAATEQMLV